MVIRGAYLVAIAIIVPARGLLLVRLAASTVPQLRERCAAHRRACVVRRVEIDSSSSRGQAPEAPFALVNGGRPSDPKASH